MESCQDIYKINTSKYNTVLSIRSNLELIERLNKYINSDICKTPKHKPITREYITECNNIKLYLHIIGRPLIFLAKLKMFIRLDLREIP